MPRVHKFRREHRERRLFRRVRVAFNVMLAVRLYSREGSSRADARHKGMYRRGCSYPRIATLLRRYIDFVSVRRRFLVRARARTRRKNWRARARGRQTAGTVCRGKQTRVCAIGTANAGALRNEHAPRYTMLFPVACGIPARASAGA